MIVIFSPICKNYEWARLEDVHLVFLNKQITNKMQNSFYLIAEHFGFIKYLNKLDEIIWISEICNIRNNLENLFSSSGKNLWHQTQDPTPLSWLIQIVKS